MNFGESGAKSKPGMSPSFGSGFCPDDSPALSDHLGTTRNSGAAIHFQQPQSRWWSRGSCVL